MWKLTARGESGTPFAELGSYASLGDAAQKIFKTENDQSLGGIFFRVFVDPTNPPSDAKALSRLEYQSAKRFYLLTRNAH
jgi:hypothetical protein